MYNIVAVLVRSRVQFSMLRFLCYYIITTIVTNWTPCTRKSTGLLVLDSYWIPTGLLVLDSSIPIS